MNTRFHIKFGEPFAILIQNDTILLRPIIFGKDQMMSAFSNKILKIIKIGWTAKCALFLYPTILLKITLLYHVADTQTINFKF